MPNNINNPISNPGSNPASQPNNSRTTTPMTFEEVFSILTESQATITAPAFERRFRINLTPQECALHLGRFYMAEVSKRGLKTEWTENLRNAVRKIAYHLTKPQKYGFIFLGPTGTGKTTLVRAMQKLINWLGDKNHFDFMRYPGDGWTVRPQLALVDVREVLDEVADRRTKWRNGLAGKEMLAIDDLGKEQINVMDYGTVRTPVVDLLEHRYNRMLYTVITTNLAGQDIRPRYGDRVADRLNEMCIPVTFNDTSFRDHFAED